MAVKKTLKPQTKYELMPLIFRQYKKKIIPVDTASYFKH